MVIGLAQSFNHLAKFQQELFEGYAGGKALRVVLTSFYLGIGMYLSYVHLGAATFNEIGIFSAIIMAFILASALAGILYLTTYSIVALSTGFFSFPLWFHHTVEVDAAPLETPTMYKSFSDLDSLKSSSLRHGIYDMPEVQMEVASAISAVARGKKPKLSPTLTDFDLS